MQLQSHISIKWGHINNEKGEIFSSTQASSTRTPPFNYSPTSKDLETSSKPSMISGPETSMRMPDKSYLDYNIKLNFQGLNDYSTKIYKDN